MKKLFLILMLAMVSLVSNAQTTIEAYASEFGVWDSETEEWFWDDFKACEITFLLEDGRMYASDLAGSVYLLYDRIANRREYVSWSAVDETQTDCVVTISSSTDGSYVIVMYDDICYRYYW
jgi:hypothetical protein